MRRIKIATAGVAVGLTAGIVFASSASADSLSSAPKKETTAVAFEEAAAKPDKAEDELQPMRWASLAKKAAGSFAGSAAWDYVKANGHKDAARLAKNRKGAFIRGGVGAESPNAVDLSRSFD
ncbi:hypothetical protein [Streptomyces apocyni]|uniref:hypothetical protein n=1 Tax=Streptomyces apocyni TaxID=2654677 RepID=UPI0012EA0148|nr:hypothetical protein [Streptomyces apocyni]